MANRLAVVVSQGQSQNPAKRDLEEAIVTALMFEPGFDVTVVPHLYDLTADGTGMLAMQGIQGNVVVCSWLFERAAHWILDRNGIHGKVGTTLIKPEDDEEMDDEEFEDEPDDKPRVIENRDIPNRSIFCLDLKIHESAEPYLEEIRRIKEELDIQVVGLGIAPIGGSSPGGNGATPTNGSTIAATGHDRNGARHAAGPGNGHASEASFSTSEGAEEAATSNLHRIEEKQGRRWYPVIDYSRCTNCMECIDFCLFGVYGVDSVETILVEQPDNCRKGCPACSRVCPENAILFPQHKTPAIAGSSDAVGGLKIDLSKLFGAPESGKDAIDVAVLERDEQLLQVGRDAVGMSVGIPKRQENSSADEPKDELDSLIDQLDDMDL